MGALLRVKSESRIVKQINIEIEMKMAVRLRTAIWEAYYGAATIFS